MPVMEQVYLVIALVAFALLLISMFAGDFGGDHEVGLEHDVEVGVDHDASFDHDAEADHEVGLQDSGVPSFFSLKVLLAALVGFGLFGYGSLAYGVMLWLSVLIALVGFVAMAYVVFRWVIVPIAHQQHNSTLGRDSFVGCQGTVLATISDGRIGVVRFTNRNGSVNEEQATAASGVTLPAGTAVIVTEVQSDKVVVVPDPTVHTEV